MSEQRNLLHLVSFELGRELFVAPITDIQEIIRYRDVVNIPKSPDFIEGIINLRGKVIAVIDLKKRFGMDDAGKRKSRIIISEISGVRIGLAVDAVSRVFSVDRSSFEKTPSIISDIEQKFVSGIVKDADDIFIMLDLDKIFKSEETELLKTVD